MSQIDQEEKLIHELTSIDQRLRARNVDRGMEDVLRGGQQREPKECFAKNKWDFGKVGHGALTHNHQM